MNKLLKKVIFHLGVTLSLLLSSTTVFAADNIEDKIDKHRVHDADKIQLDSALKKANYQNKINQVYPDKSKVTFSEPIKLYKLPKDNILKKYNKNLKLTSFITEDYDIIQSILDENGNAIGIIHFVKGKGLVEAQDAINTATDQKVKDDLARFAKENEGKWYVAGLGGGMSPEGIRLLTDFNVIREKLQELQVNNINDLAILASNGYLPNMVYIQTDSGEYVLPIAANSGRNYQTGNLYKLEDLINNNIKVFDEAAASGETIAGGGSSTNLPAMIPVTFVENSRNFSIQNLIPSFIILAIIACLAVPPKFKLNFKKR